MRQFTKNIKVPHGFMYPTLALISLCALLCLALFPLARRSGTPLLIIVLVIGMLAGEDGPGGLVFNNFELAFDLGSVALAIILFASGLETDRGALKQATGPSLSLAFPGVLLTAGILAITAHLLLDIPLLIALLLGAVLAPTDAAATFMLIQSQDMRLPKRVKSTLLLESGFNDPTGIGLTIGLTVIVGAMGNVAPETWTFFASTMALQVFLGTIAGIFGGLALVLLLNNLSMPDGTYPAVALTGALLVFSSTSLFGGSGFLAVYIAGLLVRNRLTHSLERIANFSEGLQWLSQMLLFLLLGLLVTPSALPGQIIPALLCAGVLIFAARPLAVFLSIGMFGFTFRELLFISWVGLRGAVPILLAIYPVIEPGPISHDFFNTVFIVVLATLSVQGFTTGMLSRALKLDTGQSASPET